METDDVDQVLVRQLSCLGTTDKEMLVRQFQQIVGVPLPPDMCAFFLDMTDWNIQAAVGAYYDHGERNNVSEMTQVADLSSLGMQFVRDVTIGEGESVPPLSRFVKTWRIRNSGILHWPEGSYLSHCEGDILPGELKALVECVAPGQEVDVSVNMESPGCHGMYQSRWQMNTSQGIAFGDLIWCIVQVDSEGILDITQQMASTYSGAHETCSSLHVTMRQDNPFLLKHTSDRDSIGLDSTECHPGTPCTSPEDDVMQ